MVLRDFSWSPCKRWAGKGQTEVDRSFCKAQNAGDVEGEKDQGIDDSRFEMLVWQA